MYNNDVINPFSNQALESILTSMSNYVASLISEIEMPKISIESYPDFSRFVCLFLDDISDDELELFTNAEFWKAYKEVRKGNNIETGTSSDLRKSVGL